MRTKEEIEAEFAGKGVERGGLLLLPVSEALAMIKRCCESGLRILGIDGFNITDEVTQPLMEHSIDLSRDEIVSDKPNQHTTSCQDALEFISARSDKGLYFEVTIE